MTDDVEGVGPTRWYPDGDGDGFGEDPTDPPTTPPTPTKGEEGGCACDQSPARAVALAPIALGIAWGRRRRGPPRQESRGLAKVVVAKGGE